MTATESEDGGVDQQGFFITEDEIITFLTTELVYDPVLNSLLKDNPANGMIRIEKTDNEQEWCEIRIKAHINEPINEVSIILPKSEEKKVADEFDGIEGVSYENIIQKSANMLASFGFTRPILESVIHDRKRQMISAKMGPRYQKLVSKYNPENMFLIRFRDVARYLVLLAKDRNLYDLLNDKYLNHPVINENAGNWPILYVSLENPARDTNYRICVKPLDGEDPIEGKLLDIQFIKGDGENIRLSELMEKTNTGISEIKSAIDSAWDWKWSEYTRIFSEKFPEIEKIKK